MVMKASVPALSLGVIVGDIEASLHFYRDVLGLEKVAEVALPFGQMHRLMFGQSGIKLVDPKQKPIAAGAAGILGELGFRYITFEVTNLAEVDARCAEAGLPYELPLQELIPGLMVLMLRDPDGNIVEILQRL
jgi:glyoxylase I family protein